jgi:hypothetical protein
LSAITLNPFKGFIRKVVQRIATIVEMGEFECFLKIRWSPFSFFTAETQRQQRKIKKLCSLRLRGE